jgi:hypothetical protein
MTPAMAVAKSIRVMCNLREKRFLREETNRFLFTKIFGTLDFLLIINTNL